MSKIHNYQIVAYVEKFNFNKDEFCLELKGVGKYFFEYEQNKEKYCYNILEPKLESVELTSTNEPKPVEATICFYCELNKNDNVSEGIISNLLVHGFIENKRLKFQIKHASNKYTITSIERD